MKPRMSLRDLGSEALAGLFARPGRAVLTVLGTVLGIAALVGTLGVSKTASNQIVGRFDALAATEVIARPREAALGGAAAARAQGLPWDAGARVARLHGVTAAGTLSEVDVGQALVRAVPVRDTLNVNEFQLPVKAVSPGLFGAVKAKLRTGRVFDEGNSERGDRVVVLGPGAAQRLGVTRVDNQPGIFIGNRLYQVVGILDDVARQAELLESVILPNGTAKAIYRLRAPETVHVDTVIGAAQQVGRQAAIALDPNDPESIEVTTPPEARGTRTAVQNDLDSLFLVLGIISLVIGAIGIANVTLVSVLERTGEIGLRRSLGAARRHIAAQFLGEAAMTGLAGGVIGASIGVLATVGYGYLQGTTPVIDPWAPLMGPGLGIGTGLLAGVYPALKAALQQPVESLRSGT